MILEPVFTQLRLFAINCAGGEPNFFGLPTWYRYVCAKPGAAGNAQADFVFPDDLSLVALAILDILLRIAALVAIGYVIYGGVKYITSQGEPGKISGAKNTIINALIGLVIATFATAIVAFIGNRLG